VVSLGEEVLDLNEVLHAREGLSDVPDRDERLAWARDVHTLMRLKDNTANLVDRQFHSRAVYQASNAIDADQTWADLDSMRRSGAAYLQPYIEFTSSMAKHQGKIDEMAKVISSGRQLLIALDDYIASSLRKLPKTTADTPPP